MKSLGFLIIAGLVAAFPVSAQLSLRTGSLGGPASARAFSHPLGGFGPGFNGFSNLAGRAPNRRLLSGYPYAYSVWVPDYYDYLDYRSQYTGAYPLPPDPYAPAPATTQQPVIINQYFNTPPPQQQATAPQQSNAPEASANTSAPTPGDPIGVPRNYYLIAYKNHSVYPALAYWVEDKTLHYVTTENTHNQASLDLIDVALTKSLNQKNEVPFEIPGR